jgi:hypothetical protein
MPTRRYAGVVMGRLRDATDERIGQIDAPDVALVALAHHLAGMIEDPDLFSAAAVREYRATMSDLVKASAAGPLSLDDVDSM